MVVSGPPSRRCLNSRSDKEQDTRARRGSLRLRAIQGSSATGIEIPKSLHNPNSHSPPHRLFPRLQDVPPANPATTCNRRGAWFLRVIATPTLSLAHPAAQSLQPQRGTNCDVSLSYCAPDLPRGYIWNQSLIKVSASFSVETTSFPSSLRISICSLRTLCPSKRHLPVPP